MTFKLQFLNSGNSELNLVPSRIKENVWFRCPELEVVSRKEYWEKFLQNYSLFIRNGFPLFDFAPPFVWDKNPYNNASWLLYFHSLYFIGTIYLGIKTLPVDDELYKKISSYLKDLIFSYFDFLDTQKKDYRVPAWDDHSTGYRASYLSLAYSNILKPILSADEEVRFKSMMYLHSKVLNDYTDSGKWTNSNHTIFHIEGLIDIVQIFFDEPESGEQLQKCSENFKKFIENNISISDGTSKEHAQFYHPFLMERIRVHYLYLNINLIKVEVDILEILRKMNRFLWISMPVKGLMLPVGDTKYDMYINDKYYREFLSDQFCDDEVKYLITDSNSGVRPNFFQKFTDDGYYIFRDFSNLKEGLFSTFLEKCYIGPHGHVDGASFVTFFGSQPIFIDSGGPYKYRDKLRHSYFQSQLAHNTAIFDGPCNYLNKVTSSISGPNYAFVVSESDMGGGNFWYRVFGQLDSKLIIVLDLAICSDKLTPVQVRYHLAPEVRFADMVNQNRIFNVGDKKFYILFQELDGICDQGTDRVPSNEVTQQSRSFDLNKFPIHEQSLALVTRRDGVFESGNLICHPLKSGRPLLMLADFGLNTQVKVVQKSTSLILEFIGISNIWPGSKLCINWPTKTCELSLKLV